MPDKNAQISPMREYKMPNGWRSHRPTPGRTVFHYNKLGKVSGETFYAPDGALVYKTDSTYNDAGNLLEQKNSSSDSNNVGKVSFEYDSQGNLIK
jgi:hypothetical protein